MMLHAHQKVTRHRNALFYAAVVNDQKKDEGITQRFEKKIEDALLERYPKITRR